MPANANSLRISNTYQQHLSTLRGHAVAAAKQGWGQLDPDELDRSHAAWAAQTAATVTAVQSAGVQLSAAYAAAYASSELGTPPPSAPAPTAPVGTAPDGRPLEQALLPSLFTVKGELGDGKALQVALAIGLARALRTTSDAAIAPARQQLAGTIEQEPQALGWRRVARPGACGACLAAMTGKVMKPRERLKIHPFCDCFEEPVFDGVPDTHARPTGRAIFERLTPSEQDQRLGEAKAKLIRSGAVPFHALIQHNPMEVVPDLITEAPLHALEAHEHH